MEKDSSTTDKQEKKFVDVKLKANDVETAYIAHVDDVENIYCQLTKQEDTLYECKSHHTVEIFSLMMI